jgi:hypothetical protein
MHGDWHVSHLVGWSVGSRPTIDPRSRVEAVGLGDQLAWRLGWYLHRTIRCLGLRKLGAAALATRSLTVDVWDPPHAQQYNPLTRNWTNVADTPVSLADPCGSFEMGPAVTRPDGTVVAFGGYSCASADPTAIYTPFNDTWATGPNVPQIGGRYYDLSAAGAGQTLTPSVGAPASSVRRIGSPPGLV